MQKNPRLSAIIERLLQHPQRIQSVQIAVGELITFTEKQIHVQWNDTFLAQSTLIIRRVPAQQQCMTCFEKYRPASAEVSCPYCGSVGAKIIAGEEFFLESIELKNE